MERAIYALAVAVLVHAAATYFSGAGRYAPLGSSAMLDTRTGSVWAPNLDSEYLVKGNVFAERIRRAEN